MPLLWPRQAVPIPHRSYVVYLIRQFPKRLALSGSLEGFLPILQQCQIEIVVPVAGCIATRIVGEMG